MRTSNRVGERGWEEERKKKVEEEEVWIGTSLLKSSRPKSCRASSRPPSKYTAPEESRANRKSETSRRHCYRK